MGKIALVIGRFQPLHLGHVSMLRALQGREDLDRVLVGLGSAQESGTNKNPFSVTQRKEMLLRSGLVASDDIFAVADFVSDEEWVDYLMTILPSFDIVVSGNPWVQGLFAATHEIVAPDMSQFDVCATQIREWLRAGEWDDVSNWVLPEVLVWLQDTFYIL